jgi:hypothetical protein
MSVLLKAAALITRRRWARWNDLTAKPQETQNQLLRDIINRNRETRFGRDHCFVTVGSLTD